MDAAQPGEPSRNVSSRVVTYRMGALRGVRLDWAGAFLSLAGFARFYGLGAEREMVILLCNADDLRTGTNIVPLGAWN